MKLLTATALATILAITPAVALIQNEVINPDLQQRNEETLPHEPEDTDHWKFTCIPEERNPHEKDPVIRVHVTADFVTADNWKLTDLTVRHETYSGRLYDRGEQYTSEGFYGRFNSKDYLWIWNGVKKDEPHHHITGALFFNGIGKDNKWHYSERHEIQKKGKKPQISWVSTTCNDAKKGTE